VTLIHVAPLPLVHRLLPLIEGGRIIRAVAVGTTSRYTKFDSANGAEQRMVAEQEAAEHALISACSHAQIPWTLLRPTMVYDGRNDRNVAFIIRCIQRFGFFPMIGDGRGLRQPLHVDDLAKACVDVMRTPATYCRDYNLAGGQRLPYYAMVEFIFTVMDRDTRIVKVPTLLLKAMLQVLRLVPSYRYLNTAMVERINEDLVFDYSTASRDFGFKPRQFLAAGPQE
jgi:nucleoside-diphosphate-sugar epimerase